MLTPTQYLQQLGLVSPENSTLVIISKDGKETSVNSLLENYAKIKVNEALKTGNFGLGKNEDIISTKKRGG